MKELIHFIINTKILNTQISSILKFKGPDGIRKFSAKQSF